MGIDAEIWDPMFFEVHIGPFSLALFMVLDVSMLVYIVRLYKTHPMRRAMFSWESLLVLFSSVLGLFYFFSVFAHIFDWLKEDESGFATVLAAFSTTILYTLAYCASTSVTSDVFAYRLVLPRDWHISVFPLVYAYITLADRLGKQCDRQFYDRRPAHAWH